VAVGGEAARPAAGGRLERLEGGGSAGGQCP
jgi:hypothetical protein